MSKGARSAAKGGGVQGGGIVRRRRPGVEASAERNGKEEWKRRGMVEARRTRPHLADEQAGTIVDTHADAAEEIAAAAGSGAG